MRQNRFSSLPAPRPEAGIDRWLDHDSPVTRLWRFVLLCVAVTGEVFANIEHFRSGEDTYADRVSYFTVQSNWLVIAVLLLCLLPRDRLGNWFDAVRGAVSFYIFMTGLIVMLILQSPSEVLFNWDVTFNEMTSHRLIPLFLLLDMLIVPWRNRPVFLRPLVWIIYPILFLVYSLVRGSITGWYPYPFLDMNNPAGFNGILPDLLQVVAAFLVAGFAVSTLGYIRNIRKPQL